MLPVFLSLALPGSSSLVVASVLAVALLLLAVAVSSGVPERPLAVVDHWPLDEYPQLLLCR